MIENWKTNFNFTVAQYNFCFFIYLRFEIDDESMQPQTLFVLDQK